MLNRFFNLSLSLCFIIIFNALMVFQAFGSVSENRYGYMSADLVSFDKEKQILFAKGNVYINGDGKLSIFADEIIFNKITGKVKATGNVILKDNVGNISFIDSIEVSADLLNADINGIRVLLSDKSKLVAKGAQRVDGNKSIMENVQYSPCVLCYKKSKGEQVEQKEKCDSNCLQNTGCKSEGQRKRPTWSIAADKVIWDHESKTISYEGASFRLLDNKILYLPFFAHPDPSVKRKNGILFPIIDYDEVNMGPYVGVPYYYYFSKSHDVTITPYVGAKAQLLYLDYRKHFGRGVVELKGSIARTPKDSTSDNNLYETHSHRAHIDASFAYDINDNWRIGAKVERASDRTYPLKFSPVNMPNKYQLDSIAFFEGFFDRAYTKISSMSFQGLRIDDKQNQIPIILPKADYYYYSPKDKNGGSYKVYVNALGLSRDKGSSSRRLHIDSTYELSKIASIGLRTDFMANITGDLYSISEYKFDPNDASKDYSGFKGRLHPSFYVKSSYPLYKKINNNFLIIEPMAAIKVSPKTKQDAKIPNEDNRIFELDDTNLMMNNRQNGIDLLDTGSRFDYGVKFSYGGVERDYSADLFIGQSMNMGVIDDLFSGSGVTNNLSDIVLRANFSPYRTFRLRYRGRIDARRLTPKRTELIAYLGKEIFNSEISYNSIDKFGALQGEDPSQQLSLAFSSRFTEHLRARIFTKRNIGDNTEPLAHGFSISYDDDCSIFKFSVERLFYSDGEIKPGYKASIGFNLKNLGKFKKQKHFDEL